MTERRSFDAVVVGSGASGGCAAKELTERGLDVALVEAGPEVPFGDPVSDPGPAGSAERQAVQARCYAYGESTRHLFVDDRDNPYSFPEDKPFDWIRGRVVGGRLHTWGRMSVRMSDWELKAAGRDGIGAEWPISYGDLAPHYDRIERYMRVCGTAEGLRQLPDGAFVGAPHLSAGELSLKAAVESTWETRRVTGARIALAPPQTMIAAARATGRLTLFADAVVESVSVAGDRARGVVFVGRESGERQEIGGRVVMLCASAIESARILLNSSSAVHPEGLANSSGLVGRYLMDHTYGIGIEGSAMQPLGGSRDGTLYGCLIPAFRNVTETEVDFAREYGIELQVHTPQAGPIGRLLAARRERPGFFWMRSFGEVLPSIDNRVTLDPERTDAWGIPVAHIECSYGENERRMAVDQLARLEEIAEAAGLSVELRHSELANPGLSVHEMGTARMGSDPSDSVLNGYAQSWDVPNLFVADGSGFASSGFQNPTLTMMAIAARASEYAVEQLRSGVL